jgi:putative membrane protein
VTVRQASRTHPPPLQPGHALWLGAGFLALAAAQVDRPYVELAALQHIPSLVGLLACAWLARRGRLSVAATGCIVLFLIAHTIGGRYLYTNTPYDQWIAALLGSGPSDWFGWTRNHYDRFVHFLFGALAVRPYIELTRHVPSRPKASALIAATGFVLAASAAYEVFEWGLTLVMSGEDAERYNGQQGDFWDAQKDMALAWLGAVAAALLLRLAAARRQSAP